jgi:hypothetical protein
VTAVEDTRVVIRDVFPAAVIVGDRTYRSALAVITRDRLYVYLTRAAPVLDAPYDPALSTVPGPHSSRFAAAHLTLTSGGVATMVGQRGCGCSNPLKGWHPWTPYRKAPA